MPAKKKKRSSTRRLGLRGRHRGDPVSIQISVRLKRVPKGMKITHDLLSAMVRRKAETSSGYWDQRRGRVIGAREGKDPSGIELKIVQWKNPGRNSGKDRAWRKGSQADAWGSLRQVIERASIRFR